MGYGCWFCVFIWGKRGMREAMSTRENKGERGEGGWYLRRAIAKAIIANRFESGDPSLIFFITPSYTLLNSTGTEASTLGWTSCNPSKMCSRFSTMPRQEPTANWVWSSQVCPKICAQGRKPRARVSGLSACDHRSIMPMMLEHKFSWDNSTPLGLPVMHAGGGDNDVSSR